MHCYRNKYLWQLPLLLLLAFAGCRNEKKDPVSEEEFNYTKSKMVEVNKILVRRDRQLIERYAERHGLDMKETETGLWYEIIEKGSGEKVRSGKTVSLNYKVSLLSGTECYNSDKDGPKEFIVGKGNVESGLEEGILMLSEGSRARFILPPHLAYGLPGDGNKIPARAIIIYDIDLLSVK